MAIQKILCNSQKSIQIVGIAANWNRVKPSLRAGLHPTQPFDLGHLKYVEIDAIS